NLFRESPQPPGRFLEKIQRWIPRVELVADANISQESDRYLPEHVFEGTPMFPGVMAIEGMVQAATACMGCKDLPVLRNIAFNRPLIVPEGSPVVVRTLALAEARENGAVCVRVAMRSNSDGFQGNHFEAECWFGLPAAVTDSLPTCLVLPKRLEVNPEHLSPVPLFQGKFCRRIEAIRRMDL